MVDNLVCIADRKKVVKMDSAQRKKLADISNLQQRFKPTSQDFKRRSTTLTTKEYIEKLHKVYMFAAVPLCLCYL